MISMLKEGSESIELCVPPMSISPLIILQWTERKEMKLRYFMYVLFVRVVVLLREFYTSQ